MAGWALVAAWLLVSIVLDLNESRRELSSLRADLESTQLLSDDAARQQLRDEAERIADVSDRLGSLWLAPVRVLPVIGRQHRSAAALTEATGEILTSGTTLLDEVERITEGGFAPEDREVSIGHLHDTVGEVRSRLEALDLGPDNALLGPLARARDELSEQMASLTPALRRADAGLGGLAHIFGTDGDWLLLAANTAQMQNGHGMLLSHAVVRSVGGHLALQGSGTTTDLPRPSPPVVLPEDLGGTWPALDPNADWRHLGAGVRFPVTASVATEMWTATTGQEILGVISVDPQALAALLALTGPVEVDGTQIGSEDAIPLLLHDQYLALGPDSTVVDVDRAERRDQLADVVAAVLEELDHVRDVDLSALEGLVDAASGRHLLVWATDPAVQADVLEADLAGELEDRSLAVGLLNRGGNKLDWFTDITVDASVDRGEETSTVELSVAISNHVGPDEPKYVTGPYPGSGLAAGDYLGILAVTAPTGATNLRIEDAPLVTSGADGSHGVIAGLVRVPAGGEQRLVVRFDLPAEVRSLDIEPSARARAVTWRYGAERSSDDLTFTLRW